MLCWLCFPPFSLHTCSGNVPEGYTYATYAQNGFWQLVEIAVIVAAVVFIVKNPPPHGGGQPGAALALIVLCAAAEVVLVSAFWRMSLYEQAYSLSILRIFTQAFMVATAGVFGVLIAGLAKPGLNIKKWIFVVGMVCYIALNYMNADAFIARQNVAIGGEAADVVYLTQLSADALPYYADSLRTNDEKKTGRPICVLPDVPRDCFHKRGRGKSEGMAVLQCIPGRGTNGLINTAKFLKVPEIHAK